MKPFVLIVTPNRNGETEMALVHRADKVIAPDGKVLKDRYNASPSHVSPRRLKRALRLLTER